MSSITQPTTIVIFGISGDLAHRSLLPALQAIAKSGALPEQTRIVGITRQALETNELFEAHDDSAWLEDHLSLFQMNPAETADYEALKHHLETIESDFNSPSQRLFYLSVPPQVSGSIITHLGQSGLSNVPHTKLLIEKPFGTDLASAKELVTHIRQYFEESQIYRIDHFLAKEMAQNLVVFRSSNALFRSTWNHHFIESIEVLLHEHIDIEGRANFYEQTGAVRDVLQSHLLQLAALTLMELPETGDPAAIPGARLGALQQLETPTDIDTYTRRGQYAGYRDEVATPHTTVETFASITLHSSNPTWQEVPITITTGKALDRTSTEIRLKYRQKHDQEANELVLRVQPNEGIEIDLWVKKPGYDRSLEKKPLSFTYDMHYTDLPKAYERVFMDAMRGDHSLFATSEEVIESWRIIDPVLKHWEMIGERGLVTYEKGVTAAAVSELAAQQ